MDDARAAAAGSPAVGRWPEVALVAAGLVIVANAVMLVIAWPRGDEPWAIGQIAVLLVTVVVRVRRPELMVSAWISFSILAVTVGELANTTLSALLERDSSSGAIASGVAVGQISGALGGAFFIQILATYPDDQPRLGWERHVVHMAWALVALPVVVILSAGDIPIPYYFDIDRSFANPFDVLPFTLSTGTTDAIEAATPLLLLGGVSILIAHYRRAGSALRRRMRWLLVPFPFVLFAVILSSLVGESQVLVIWIVFVVLNPAIPIAGAIGILQPYGWDPDRVLRRALVYGTLWVAIVGSLVATAAIAGTTAGRFVPIGWAVVIAIVVSLVFQPLRRRLESWASRRVFGERVDHSGVITGLGETLAQTFELETLLPRMVAALEGGLQLEWAQVRLRGVPDGEGCREPEVSVPIDLDGEQLGVLECGPKIDGNWTDDDRAVVATFARQAALAVRNVRLTEQTARYAADVATSRSRIARAAESERRRIERNIHDGIQQDLVVLIGMAGRVQDEPDHEVMAAGMVELRRRLERVLGDLRNLAQGIYPSVLSDQGILPAIEALVEKHPHPIRLRADPDLREQRFPTEIEGAAYFTVAEALTNSLKHSVTGEVDIMLTRRNGSLMIEVADDGIGFDASHPSPGRGLEGLADRIGALGGSFTVDSEIDAGTVVHASLSITNGVTA